MLEHLEAFQNSRMILGCILKHLWAILEHIKAFWYPFTTPLRKNSRMIFGTILEHPQAILEHSQMHLPHLQEKLQDDTWDHIGTFLGHHRGCWSILECIYPPPERSFMMILGSVLRHCQTILKHPKAFQNSFTALPRENFMMIFGTILEHPRAILEHPQAILEHPEASQKSFTPLLGKIQDNPWDHPRISSGHPRASSNAFMPYPG